MSDIKKVQNARGTVGNDGRSGHNGLSGRAAPGFHGRGTAVLFGVRCACEFLRGGLRARRGADVLALRGAELLVRGPALEFRGRLHVGAWRGALILRESRLNVLLHRAHTVARAFGYIPDISALLFPRVAFDLARLEFVQLGAESAGNA